MRNLHAGLCDAAPYIAPATSAGVFIALIVVWSLSASILRAAAGTSLAPRRPERAARHRGGPRVQLGVAGALAPMSLNFERR